MLCYRERISLAEGSSHKTKYFAFAVCIFLSIAAYSQSAIPGSPSAANLNSTKLPLSSADIVEQMLHRNQERAAELRHYESVRHYSVQYKGYTANIAATLVVDATYDVATGKSFRILSQTGNKLLVDKVLKRLVESEKDADRDKSSTALTPANYQFSLDGTDIVNGRPAYVLNVEPLVDSKYLYRGKIWVDSADFAVTRIAAQPAKNPSIWISSTAINHQYTRVDGFWLPAENRSETHVRVGGTAELTIDYGKYQVEGQGTVDSEQRSGISH